MGPVDEEGRRVRDGCQDGRRTVGLNFGTSVETEKGDCVVYVPV